MHLVSHLLSRALDYLYIEIFVIVIHPPMYIVQCTMYSVQCTIYNVQCTMYSVQCTMYNVQCITFWGEQGGHRVKEMGG